MYNVKKLYTFSAVFLSVNCNKELLRMEDIMRKITDLSLEKYKEYLYEEEKSVAIVNKYINDLNNTTLQLFEIKDAVQGTFNV